MAYNHETIVRLKNETFKRGDMLFVGKSIRVMRKSSVLTFDDLGFFDGSVIVNINDSIDDGLYTLIPVNIRRDWESGIIDHMDYKLVSFTEKEI